MRIFLITGIIVCCLSTLFAQTGRNIILPQVDKRVELMSICFRLAECQEYCDESNEQYVADIHRHFDKYKDHPLIKYIKKIRSENGIGYDAVMAMAVHLNAPPELTPIITFSKKVPEKRWGNTSGKFVTLLAEFYKDAACEHFFNSHESYYTIVGQRFSLLFNKLDLNWYYEYYGKNSTEIFCPVIGIGNGGNNYGPNIIMPDKIKKVYAILGSWSFDSTGLPVYPVEKYLPTLIHEFNHSFINHLVDIHERQFKNAGELLYEKQNVVMKKQAYGEWKTMICESLVRASVIRYMENHTTDTKNEIEEQRVRGFIWIKELADLLGRYEASRDKYATFEDFMPVIVHFYDTMAPHINEYDLRYQQHLALHNGKIVSIVPFANGDTAVDPNISEIQFNFDKPLDGKRYFFGPGKTGLDHYPSSPTFHFSNGNKTLIMNMKLLPNTEYEINMIGEMMRTDEGYNLQNYLLHFKTGSDRQKK